MDGSTSCREYAVRTHAIFTGLNEHIVCVFAVVVATVIVETIFRGSNLGAHRSVTFVKMLNELNVNAFSVYILLGESTADAAKINVGKHIK